LGFSAIFKEMREDKGMKRAQIVVFGAILAVTAVFSGTVCAQGTPTPSAESHDKALEAASNLIGKALFLRCFCAENNLSFDAQGQPVGTIKTTDWTLAGVSVQKVERKNPGEIELQGVRVAIRFATDRREFDRKPLNDDKMKIQLADTGDLKAFARELSAVFAEGLDRKLQLAMPSYWQHYFDPQMAWPPDELSGVTIYGQGATTRIPANESFVPVGAAKRASAAYTPQASRDRVTGPVDLRVVIDAKGDLHHVAVEQPLGYGLDARAVEALAKWKFTPAKLAGKPVAASSLIRPEFAIIDVPH
jgi:TonB family protein